MNKEFELETKTFEKSGILVEAFEVPGKIALWLEDESKGEILVLKKATPLD